MSGRNTRGDPPPDPFAEVRRPALSFNGWVLGSRLRIESDSPALMHLARQAFAGLPAHRLTPSAPRLTVRLLLAADARSGSRAEPPQVLTHAARGILGASFAGGAFVSVAPQARSALVVVPRRLLRHPYHVRYELLELAVYLLAARSQGLVPLHAACVGAGTAGVLVCGASGAGKSTFTLAAAAAGLALVSEDSVLAEPGSLRATGLASYLHLRRAGLRLLPQPLRQRLRRAPVIRRRSGVRKLEIDARGVFVLAQRPLRLRGLIFLSPRPATGGELLHPLSPAAARSRLAAGQRYAQGQRGWARFAQGVARLPAFELRRAPPQVQVAAVRALMQTWRR